MDIGRYVAQLRDDLTAAAAAGDEQTQRTAALLGAALEPAARLTLMNALADLAAEITAELGDRTVDVRLDGRDVRVAVGPEHVAEPPPPPPPPRGPGVDTGDISRITLRLVEQIKGQAEQAAAAQGVSLNAWVAQAVQGALSGQRRRGNWGGPRGPRGNVGRAGRPRDPPARRARRRPAPARLGGGVTDMDDLVRQESRTAAGPADLDVAVDVGRVEVHLDEAAGADGGAGDGDGGDGGGSNADGNAPGEQEVRVEVRHDPAAAGGWAQRIGEVASWLGSVGAAPDTDDGTASAGADAVRAAEISWSAPGAGGEAPTLTVRSTTDLPLRMVPLVVTVWAPAGSRVTARTGAGDVSVTGRSGRATVRTGAGTATTADVDGDAEVTTGSGDVVLGAVGGRARIRTGSGAIRIGAVAGATDVKAGSGDVIDRPGERGRRRAHGDRRRVGGRRPGRADGPDHRIGRVDDRGARRRAGRAGPVVGLRARP